MLKKEPVVVRPETPEPLQMSDEVLQAFSLEEQYLLRPMKSVVLNMEAVVKFHRNPIENQQKKNPFISWTLNKVAVIDKDWLGKNKDGVKDMSWWRVKVEHETSPGQPVGCFILRPLWEINRSDLVILAPSTWNMVQHGLSVLLYPKIKPWMPWIMPKALRRTVMRKTGGAALLIPLSYPPEGAPKPEMDGALPDSGILAEMMTDPDIEMP